MNNSAIDVKPPQPAVTEVRPSWLRESGNSQRNEAPPRQICHNENDTRRELRKTKIFNVFREFNENTTLHGLKYLTERDLTIFERVFWLVMFLISLVLCCWLMNNVWWKWQDTPIIISFHEKLVPVWQVPFPSVTICPQMKARASVYNYTEKNIYKYRYATQSTYDPELEKLDNVALVCENRYYLKREICNHTIVKDIREENDATPDLSLILKEYMPDLDKYCNRYYDGFKIYLHHPVDMPRSIAHHYSVLHDETTSLAVNFEMITTSENLENYSPQTLNLINMSQLAAPRGFTRVVIEN
ncbi:Pickpocket protein 28 [Eumeta japonica]|uniref:Pickpocket protein 28 n=1 Tax=Eumeta variegata TaxID=151549 RepID=A0A4C1VGC9_EUMVA|nr:Pickpocket protein 28 [Eumeta japonica]